jgi:hypothetical protein
VAKGGGLGEHKHIHGRFFREGGERKANGGDRQGADRDSNR